MWQHTAYVPTEPFQAKALKLVFIYFIPRNISYREIFQSCLNDVLWASVAFCWGGRRSVHLPRTDTHALITTQHLGLMFQGCPKYHLFFRISNDVLQVTQNSTWKFQIPTCFSAILLYCVEKVFWKNASNCLFKILICHGGANSRMGHLEGSWYPLIRPHCFTVWRQTVARSWCLK
jgi:hypothetical protein